MRGFLEDLWWSARALRVRLGITCTVTAVLGLGLGAVVTVFCIADAFLFRSLPFPDADRLVWLLSRSEGNLLGVSRLDSQDWKSAPGIFEDLAQINARDHMVVEFGEGAESLLATRTTSNLFSVLGVKPLLGQPIPAAEDKPGAGRSVLLSHALWLRRFGADPSVLGRQVTVDGAPYTIVGIMPPGFEFPERSELWLSSSAWADQWLDRRIRVDSVVARLKPGVTLEQARSALAAISLQLEGQHPETNTGIRAEVLPLREVWIGESRTGLLLLLSACGALFLLACINVINLLLVWFSSREKELAIRQALGAPPARQARKAVLECLLLGSAGGAVGIFLATWSGLLIQDLLPVRLPFWAKLRIDLRVAAFALAASMTTGLLISLLPVQRAFSPRSRELLRQGSRTMASRQSIWKRRNLVVSQIAISLVLLICAGLVTKSFMKLRRVDPGFSSAHALILKMDLPVFDFQSLEQVVQLYHEILDHTAAIPGVQSVGATTSMPLSGTDTWNLWEITLEGQGETEQMRNPRVHGHIVSSDYFSSMGIPLRAGRTFERQDGAPATQGAIVSRSFAERFWPGQNALGKRLRLGGAADHSSMATVVGISEDVRHQGLDAPTGLDIYFPLDLLPSWPIHLVIRADHDPSTLAPAVQRTIRNVSADLGIRDVALLSEHVSRSLWRPRIWATLFSVFSGIALVLAVTGVYGVVSTLVGQRVGEIGIRMALGAGRPEIARMVLGELAQLAAAGIVLGLGGALVVGRFLENLLFKVSAWDVPVLAASTLALTLASLLAGIPPLARALRIEPTVALQVE